MKKALFLDRDGIVNIDTEYLYKIEDFKFVEGIFDLCRFFQQRGYLIIIITNQSGIARGYYTEEDFRHLTDWMLKQFLKEGVKITDVYYCPHHPEAAVEEKYKRQCLCRKPNPGLLMMARDAYDLNLEKSLLVGDKESDVQTGINAGIGTVIYINAEAGESPVSSKHYKTVMEMLEDFRDRDNDVQ